MAEKAKAQAAKGGNKKKDKAEDEDNLDPNVH